MHITTAMKLDDLFVFEANEQVYLIEHPMSVVITQIDSDLFYYNITIF